MNIRTGMKALALALPLAAVPLKSSAQNAVKQAEKVVAEDGIKFRGNIGVGAVYEPFFNQAKPEPRLLGEIGFNNHEMNGSVSASVGKFAQTFSAKIAHPIRTSNKNLELNAGGVYKYHHINNSSNVSPVVLKGELDSSEVPLYLGDKTIGLYGEAKYNVGKNFQLRGNAEVGSYQLIEKESISGNNLRVSSDVVKDIKPYGIVGNVEAGAQYEIKNGLRVGADVNYSTLHKTPGFNINTKLNF